MNQNALRMQILVRGAQTGHNDIAGLNEAVKIFNQENALALFDTYLRRMNRQDALGTIAIPPNNPLTIRVKGN